MKRDPRSGAALILSVLLLAAITVLVGFGRLAMYRNQVKLRLDREREIQQELATRSVVRWLETEKETAPAEEVGFDFSTVRGNLSVALCPAEPVFPRRNMADDYDVGVNGRNDASIPPYRDYVTLSSKIPSPQASADGYKLVIADRGNSVGDVQGMAIDISSERVPAVWTDSDFGLRYLAYVEDFCSQTSTNDSDCLRFGITPFGGQLFSNAGISESPFAIWVQQHRPKEWADDPDRAGKALISLHFRFADQSGRIHSVTAGVQEVDAVKSKGFQLASTKASIVQQEVLQFGRDKLRSTSTLGTIDMDEKTGMAFSRTFSELCRQGIRLTVDVCANRPRADGEDGAGTEDTFRTSITKLAVTPAYEYFTVLSWNDAGGGGGVVEEVSTVIKYSPPDRGKQTDYDTVTYDTHGTYANRKNHSGDLER